VGINRSDNFVGVWGVADLDYEFSIDLFEKSNLKLIFGYVQNYHSYLDSATPVGVWFPNPDKNHVNP
jgi:hypothetical protein